MKTLPDDEATLLELLNTAPVEDGVRRDDLGADDVAAAWISARGGAGTPGEAARVRRVRDLLQAVVRGEPRAQELAPFLHGVVAVPSMDSGEVGWRLQAPADAEFAARVVLAWHELEQTRPGRLRPCGNPECNLFLIDRSHANRAQWCSMAVCGNRMKARRHYQRTRAARKS